MTKTAFFDTKPYDRIYFDKHKENFGVEIEYFESKLNPHTAVMARGYEAAVAFVSDSVDALTVSRLRQSGVRLLAMRCAGYNNVDITAASKEGLTVVRVPEYSAHAIAEHTAALLLTLVRKTHKAYNRTREYNFSLNGFTGFDLHGKTVGIIGTGRIGAAFIDICRGFGMNICAYDPYPTLGFVEYVELDELFRRADIVSLHCPLNSATHHIIDAHALSLMKNGVYIINTSRGALIDSDALVNEIRSGRVGGAGLDVYEEESDFFYEDYSAEVIRDARLSTLISMPNVLVTSHQAFLTKEALENIALTTLENISRHFSGKPDINSIGTEKKFVIN